MEATPDEPSALQFQEAPHKSLSLTLSHGFAHQRLETLAGIFKLVTGKGIIQ